MIQNDDVIDSFSNLPIVFDPTTDPSRGQVQF